MHNEFERGGRSSLENTAQFPYVSCKLVPIQTKIVSENPTQMVKSIWPESTKNEDIML